MSYRPKTTRELIKETEEKLYDSIDAIYVPTVPTPGLSSSSATFGRRNAAYGGEFGARSSIPVPREITNNEGKGDWEHIDLLSEYTIVKGTNVPGNPTNIFLKYASAIKADGERYFLTPSKGKTLTLKAGGDFDIEKDITIKDNQFIRIIWDRDSDATLDGGFKTQFGQGGSSGGIEAINKIKDYGTIGNASLAIDITYTAHKFTLSGDVTITFSGSVGVDILKNIAFFITQPKGKKYKVTWPNSIKTKKSITIESSNTIDVQTHLIGYSPDGIKSWVISNVGAKKVILDSDKGISKLSELIVDVDFDLKGKSLKDVLGIQLKEESKNPSTKGTVFFAGDFLKYKKTSSVETLATLSDIVKKINIDLSNYSGKFPISKIPDIPASRIKSGTFDIVRIPDIPASKITGLSSLNRLVNLSEFVAASGGNAAQLNLPLGTEIRNLGKIKFKTILESGIGTYDSITVKIPDPDNPTQYVTSVQSVMNFLVHGEKAMALSSFNDRLQPNKSYGTVLETLSDKAPYNTLVDTHNYKVRSNVGSVVIGGTRYDARVPDTSSGSLDFLQTTLVEFQALAETKLITEYEYYDSKKEYKRNDRVTNTTQTKAYVYISASPSSGHGLNDANRWKLISTTSTDRGQAKIILRKINSPMLGASDDEFKTILDMDWDHGVYVDSHLTTRDGAVTSLNGTVNLGGSIKGAVNSFSELNMTDHKIIGLATPVDDDDAVTKIYVDTKISGSSGGGSSANDTLSNLKKPTNVNQDLWPSQNETYNLGSTGKKWNYLHVKNLVVTGGMIEVVGGSNERNGKIGFFGETPVSRQRLTGSLSSSSTTKMIIDRINDLTNKLDNYGLL